MKTGPFPPRLALSRTLLGGALAVALSAAANGCTEKFDPPSEVKTLRVFGAQAKPGSYAKPGTKVDLELLYFDASPKAIRADGTRRPINIVWFGGCYNPSGDLYYGCFPVLAKALSALSPAAGQPPDLAKAAEFLGTGATFSINLPADIISSRPPPSGSTIPYGVSYAFFAVCAGEVAQSQGGDGGLPIRCQDPVTKQALGADDFVFGYASVYAYDELSNQNPVIDGRTFQGGPVDERPCTGDAACGAGFRCGTADVTRHCIPVVPHCTAAKLADCPKYKLDPVMDPAKNSEVDPNAKNADGSVLQEVMWAYYFASDGTIDKDTRLLNDAQAGWQDPKKIGTEWQAPGDASGETRIWGVYHDSRGGAAWTWWDVYVE